MTGRLCEANPHVDDLAGKIVALEKSLGEQLKAAIDRCGAALDSNSVQRVSSEEWVEVLKTWQSRQEQADYVLRDHLDAIAKSQHHAGLKLAEVTQALKNLAPLTSRGSTEEHPTLYQIASDLGRIIWDAAANFPDTIKLIALFVPTANPAPYLDMYFTLFVAMIAVLSALLVFYQVSENHASTSLTQYIDNVVSLFVVSGNVRQSARVRELKKEARSEIERSSREFSLRTSDYLPNRIILGVEYVAALLFVAIFFNFSKSLLKSAGYENLKYFQLLGMFVRGHLVDGAVGDQSREAPSDLPYPNEQREERFHRLVRNALFGRVAHRIIAQLMTALGCLLALWTIPLSPFFIVIGALISVALACGIVSVTQQILHFSNRTNDMRAALFVRFEAFSARFERYV